MLPIVLLAAVAALANDPQLATPPVPAAPAPVPGMGPRPPGTPTILYINYDGAILQTGCGNSAASDCSTLAHLFDGYVGPYLGSDVQKMALLEAVRRDVADFGIRVTLDRPPVGIDYTMVLYGQLGPQSFAGIAPYIDCGDVWSGDTSFAQGYTQSNSGSAVILQEAAHTWGLEHVDAAFDILNPFKDSIANPSFQDECHKIVANTQLEPVAGACNALHNTFCDTGYQNSWQEMRYLFGPPLVDRQRPQLEIIGPADGSVHVLPVSIRLLAEIRDDNHPQRYHVIITNHGAKAFDEETTGFDPLLANIQNPPPGDYDLLVTLADQAGNETRDRVRFTVLPEGSELPGFDTDTDAGQDEGDDGCACRAGGDARFPGWALAAFAIASFLARRCRRSR